MIHNFESGNKQMANELKNMSKKIKTTGADVSQIKSGTEQMAGDLAGISVKIDATGVDVVQIKEQTAGVPYFVDQDTKEARTDFQRINAMKVSMNLNDTEQKIVTFHDQEYTQEQIAAQLNISLRTVQRHVTAIKKKFSKRGLPSPFVWNNRKLFTYRMFPHTRGLYQIGGTTLLVSQGAGTFGPWMRLGTSNEIQFIRLIPSK